MGGTLQILRTGGGLLLALLLAQGPGVAHGFETDQLSGRQYEVPDSSAAVNAYVDGVLEIARARTELRMRPDWSDQKLARVLHKQIYRVFPFSFLVFGAPIEGWMTGELAERGFAVETRGPGSGWSYNLYDRYPAMFRMNWFVDLPTPALVFCLARTFVGTAIAPTFVTNHVRYGADKWSHFFRLGYRYYRRSEEGSDPLRAIHYGTKTEQGGVGFQTSGALSFADLAANYDGYLFFAELIGGPHPYFVREGDRLVQVRPFRAEEWVNHDWDELLNPNVYRKHLQAAIDLHLEQNHEEVCAAWAQWREEAASVELRPPGAYTDLSIARPQVDPFRLAERCAP